MKKILLGITLFLVSGVALSAAANFGKMQLISIVSRESGHHDIFFTATVPDQGCGYQDRALLDGESVGGKSMLSVLLSSLVSGKEVVVRVDGCLDDRPNIVKVQIYQ